MVSVFDVARYILNKLEPMSAMKLQKLVYYSQAWSLVWDDNPLFSDKIEAWANGPVVRVLYSHHRKQFHVHSRDLAGLGDARKIKGERAQTIDAVISFYGEMKPFELSSLTHMESPWITARKGMAPGDRGKREISIRSMAEYYESLSLDGEK